MVFPIDPSVKSTSSGDRTERPRVFAGRVIFDHLPKTAGMALNHWLRTVLGSGCASPNIVCDHRTLIARYGGAYSMLTAHIRFDSPGLDPRYRYVTLFREPIDRLVSWLYFVVTNHRDADLGDVWHAAKRFLEDEHAEVGRLPLANPCVQHFAAIVGGPFDSDDQLLAAALEAVERYDVWGLYESMPEFLADFATLLGVRPPPTLDRVNGTRQRPTMAEVGDRLRARLTELNALDLELYAILKGQQAEARRRWSRTSVTSAGWEPLHQPAPLASAREGFRLHAARIAGGQTHATDSLLEFDATFSLAKPVENFEVGLVIRDDAGSRVFSTTTTLLDRSIGQVAAGTHQVRGTLLARLPDGEYSLGIRFHELQRARRRELAAFDGVAGFQIGSESRTPGNAKVHLPATIHCVAIDATTIATGWRIEAANPSLGSHVGRHEGPSVVSDGRAGFLLFGPYKTVFAGAWRARVEGSFDPGANCVRIDVVSGTGRVVHAAVELIAPVERPEIVFKLEHTVPDLEIRVWVHESATARIDAIAIEGRSDADGIQLEPTTPTGGLNDGIIQSRIAPVREAEIATDAPAAEAEARQGQLHDGDERADGTAARRLAAGGDSAVGIESIGVDGPGDDPAEESPRSPRNPSERDGGHGAVDAGDIATSCLHGHRQESRLTHRSGPTVSIVIATDGRATALAELLDALPFLEGPPFEVCVVRGPTEDGIGDVLAAWQERIKIACNPVRNLSLSRNIGIAMAAGEIVAFLDDDAMPETDWLVDLAEAFRDPAVACAGGVNRDRTGTGLQYGYATANRMGQARWDRTEPADELCLPGASEFPYTQGTNTAIRRSDLEAVGGFDEEYDFYLDETDLCCRLVDAGRLVRQLPRAFVHHRSLPSAIRTADGVTHSLFSVLKNKLYFSLVNNRGHHTTGEALADFDTFVTIQERHLRRMAATSVDGPRWLERFSIDVARSRATGLARGTSGLRRPMSPGLVERHRRPFLPFARRPSAERHSCTLHHRKVVPARRTDMVNSTRVSLREQREILHRTWAELLPQGSRVALALYPDHWNVGDSAIWAGTQALLSALGVTVGYGCDPWSYDPDRLAQSVPRGPILLLGGGNLGDVYDGEQGLRIRILEDFPDRPVIQLPQSVWFRDPVARDALAALLATRRNTTLLLRDAQSLACSRTHFPVRSLLCPDAALALDLAAVPRVGDVPVVALWRRDVELDLPLPPLPSGSIVTDWRSLETANAPWSLHSRAFRAAVGDPPPGDRARAVVRRASWQFLPGLWDSLAEERTLRGCRLLSRGRVVITNRLHGHLLCMLLGIPHVICDTVNGKLSAYRQTWDTNDSLVHVAATPGEAVAMAATLAAETPPSSSKAA
jgi:exopolysaccharide biosynthesis predicted pyruvyltransferase EpsI/GT2 family glycosyltransferase